MILVVKPYLEWGSVTSMGKNQIFQSELPNNSLQNCKLLCRMLWFWFYSWFLYFRNMDTENQERKCWFLLTKQDDPTMWNQVRNSSKPSVWLLWRWLLTVCLDADALIKTLFPGLVLTPKMKISPGYEMTTNLRFHAVIGRHIILVVFIAETAVQVWTIALLFLKVV